MKQTLISFLLFISLANSQSTQSNEFSYALKLYQDKFYDLAIKEFDAFAKKYPSSIQTADALFYLGLSYKTYKQPKKALQVFRRTAIDFPNYLKADEAWLEVAQLLELEKNWNEAATAYETIKLLYSKSALAAKGLYLASQAYEKAGDLKKAMFDCRVILDEYQESAYFFKASLQLVRLLRLDGKLPEAKLELNKIKNRAELAADIRFEEAQIHLSENEYALAKKNLLGVLAENKRFQKKAEVHFLLGEIEFRDAIYNEAISHYSKSLNAETSKKAYERIADAYYLQKNYAQAVINYKKAVGIPAKFKLALALEKQNKLSEANTVLAAITVTDSKLSTELKDQLILSRAKLLKSLKNQLEIVSFINTQMASIRSVAVKLELTAILGEVYEERLENDLALGSYNRFLLSQPNFLKNDEILWRKANLLERTGKQSEAIKVFQEITNAYPLSPYLGQVELKIQSLGNAGANSQNDVNRKLSELLAQLIESSEKGDLYFALGLFNYENLLDYKAAIKYFAKANESLKDKEKRVDALLFTAKSYLALASAEENDALYKKAFEFYGNCLKEKPSKEKRFAASLGLIETQLKLIRNEKDVNQRAVKYYEKLIAENDKIEDIEGTKLTLVEYYKKSKETKKAKAVLASIKDKKLKESAYLQLAEIYFAEDSLLNAADNFREVLLNYPNSKRKYRVIKQLAMIEKKLGRKENSIQFLKMLVDQYPRQKHEEEKSAIIQHYLAQGKIADAETYLSKNENLKQSDDIVLTTEFKLLSYENLLQLAKLYDAKNEDQKAINYYQNYIRFAPSSEKDNDVYYAIGQIYVEEGRFDQALSYFERISSTFPDYAKIEQSLAIIYFKNESYSNAAKFSKLVMNRISKTDPAFITLNRNYLISLIKSKGLTNFRTQLKSYQKSFPDDSEGHARILFEYAKQERRNKNYTRSNKLLDEIIDDYDDSSYVDDASYLKGLNYIVVNNFEKAMEIFTDFPDDFPTSSILDEYYNSLGTILEQFGKNDDAIAAYQKSLNYSKSEKNKKISYAKLISLYNKLGLYESVLTTASTFIQLFPTDAKAFDIKVIIGQALSNMSRGTEAVKHLKDLKLEATSEKEPEIQYWIANAYYKMNNYEAAISEFIKIPLLSKKTKLQWVPSALYYAGRSYEKLGKNSDAVRMYEKIVTTPGIDAVFKNDAKKRIKQLENGKS